ncbi:hypothetical protein RB623_24330 [Mesorhizobium sp. LHD-90]|uniref:hypothetical protein n=1 Tax=Mesorhizobium sp. LHD-90 TaxID=3071414 RepID=UPI0027E073A6|nr:hypothetical protein [Mesorhizobium sp. LHD-90]MDQ6437193.1 hypothetical protein [Mesorhizobium sp. LHD-90]
MSIRAALRKGVGPTVPVDAMLDGQSGQALLVDMGLGVAYAIYSYGFHQCFDRLRPVRMPAELSGMDLNMRCDL